jgi:hypothetical protein
MTPRRLDNLPEKKFVQVSCGEFHNAAMTNEGEVWTWGWERAYAHPPTLIEKLGGAAVDICSARDHTCILTAHQEVYTLVLKQKRLQIPASLSQLADLLGDTHLNSCRESGLYKENVPSSAVQIASNVNTLLVRLGKFFSAFLSSIPSPFPLPSSLFPLPSSLFPLLMLTLNYLRGGTIDLSGFDKFKRRIKCRTLASILCGSSRRFRLWFQPLSSHFEQWNSVHLGLRRFWCLRTWEH